MNVLWLASWYPNRTSIHNGDFIERHAKAVAPFCTSLTVIAVVKDESLPVNGTEIQETKEGNLTAYIVYYGRSRWSGWIEKFFSVKKYTALHLAVLKKIIKEKGRPDIVHVHVTMKAGIIAKKIRQVYNIPYVVTEHSSMYYKEAVPDIYSAGNYFRQQAKSVLKNTSLLLTVSDALGKAINDNFLKISYRVVPNVVDTGLFFPAKGMEAEVLQLIHISGMGHPKNVRAIIKALIIWKKRGAEFMMHVYGDGPKEIAESIKGSVIEKNIVFHGEVPQSRLAVAVQKADVLILYSMYETFGCVLIEANACGVPVIVSDIPVFHELVTDGKNGLFAKAGHPMALADTLEKFAKEKRSFNNDRIAADAISKYSYAVVGRQIKQVYEEVLNR